MVYVLPRIPMGHFPTWAAFGRFEVRTRIVGDQQQSGLGNVAGDPPNLGCLTFINDAGYPAPIVIVAARLRKFGR
jgi:hypothetical protein